VPLRWRAHDLRLALGSAAPVGGEDAEQAFEWCLREVDPGIRAVALALLLRLAGPYAKRDGWWLLEGTPALDPSELAAVADEHGLLEMKDVYAWLLDRGLDSAFHTTWIERSARFRPFGETLAVWSGS